MKKPEYKHIRVRRSTWEEISTMAHQASLEKDKSIGNGDIVAEATTLLRKVKNGQIRIYEEQQLK